MSFTVLHGFNFTDITADILDYQGNTLASYTGQALAALGVGGRYTFVDPAGGQFAQVRLRSSAGAANSFFQLDDVEFVEKFNAQSGNEDAGYHFGATLVFTAPMGATISLFDYYGRPITHNPVLYPNVEYLGLVDEFVVGDPNGDSVPDINDGIGRIVITGTNVNSTLTFFGGKVSQTGTFTLSQSALGIYNDLESEAAFGLNITINGTQQTATGLPPGSGSVLIGAPFVRDNSSASAYYAPVAVPLRPSNSNFSRSEQGIFLQDGSSIGSVYVHGMVFGSSIFSGSVDRLIIGNPLGSISVNGDLSNFISSGDAGMWVDDDGTPTVSTQAQLSVGRTLGQMDVGGRSLMNVTVLGDLSRPALHQPRDIFRYYELEWGPDVIPDQEPARVAGILGNTDYFALNNQFNGLGIFFGRASQQIIFADAAMRNDTIMGAEWVGSAATSVQINGEMGYRDALSTGDDPSDAYAFAADGTQDITVELSGTFISQLFGVYARIVDQDGRTLSSFELFAGDRHRANTMRYHPTSPGVYYLVMTSQSDAAGNVVPVNYVATISGMASTTVGAIRTAGGLGTPNGQGPAFTLLSGSVGSLRIGTGYVQSAGGESDPGVVYNTSNGDTADSSMAFRGSSFSIPGRLYNIITGSDIESLPGSQVTVNVGGDFGTLLTGQSQSLGLGSANGDLRFFSLTVGGSIASLDVRGALGVDQDPAVFPKPVDPQSSVIIRTGTNAQLHGNIGMIRTGSYMGGGTLSLFTPNNSVVGEFLVQQDLADDGTIFTGIYGGVPGPTGVNLQLGTNSDLRFFDTPRIWQHTVPGVVTTLVPGAPMTFTDDAGQAFQITIEGGDGTTTGGTVKSIPISGSLGSAIGRIEVDLSGGSTLHITSTGTNNNAPVISLGRIVVTGADVNSRITIDGQVSVDVWRIEQTGGSAFGSITNNTPMGDIVAADMVSLNTLSIQTGDLGRTQVPAWGPALIGPFLSIIKGAAAGVDGAIGLAGDAMTAFWNGNLYRPINNAVAVQPTTSWLDDVGSPVDPYLDGLIVRTGNIQSVDVGGAIGDVIAGAGDIVAVRANADTTVPVGRFDGIVGNIYANRIGTVDVGSGQAARSFGPMADSSIVANDDINSVTSTTPGAFISGLIDAANDVPGNTDGDHPIDGISSIQLTTGGSYVGAWIGAMTLDDFWDGFFLDDGQFRGTIDHLGGMNANLLRSDVVANQINTILLTDGYYDASRTESANDINRIEAKGFRNSTVNGGDLEFELNQILVGQNLGTLTTTGMTGDIEDLVVDVLGRTGEISGQNMRRDSFDTDVALNQLTVKGNMSGSSVTSGHLVTANFMHNLVSSVISISGPMETVMVGDAIVNSSLNVTGPDGRMGHVTVRTGFTGSVTAAGPIDTIEVTAGDLDIHITTFANQHGEAGDIKMLKASGDLVLVTDIGGTVDEFNAGRNIGRIGSPGVILVHGTVKKVDVSHGQLYSDLRVGQAITDVLIGQVVNKPGNTLQGRGSIIAFGRIENITITGDFAGAITSGSGGIGVITINNGSLLPTASINVLDGTLNNVVINNGHLFGSIHADYNILSIRLNGGSDGVFGDMGVNPALSAGTSYDQFRNQLPPDVIANASVQGPRITAGFNIGRIILTNGSIFEAFIWAGRAIGTIDVTGDITNDGITTGQATVIAAGSSIFTVHATGNVRGLDVLAGIKDFGADGRQGGLGADADTVRSGRITTVQVDGNVNGLHVSAGMDPGPDGVYNTFDELVAPGISYVRSVTAGGTVSDASVFADSPTLVASPGVVTAGTTFQNQDPNLSSGAAVPGGAISADTPFSFTWGGVSGTILFTGPGHAYWDSVAGVLSLVNTKLNSSVTVDAGGTLTNFKVVTNDDASIGHITINVPLAGNSIVDVDAYALGIELAGFGGTGLVQAGMNLRSLIIGNLTGGFVRGAYWVRDIQINGNYGDGSVFDEARIDLLAGDTVKITGVDSGLVQVERDLSSFEVTGAMFRAQVRTGASLGELKAGSIDQSRISVADALGDVTVDGDVTDTSIMAGGDLGEDVAPGGTGFNADRATTGSIASIMVHGNFARSDAVAGILRGPDGFFGTSDDSVAPGRSNIGDVTIDGTQVGSNLFSEQYRISATGTLGDVTVGGQTPPNTGNFRVEALATDPEPIRVADLQLTSVSGQWMARFIFNQEMDYSTFGPALTISEIRDSGLTVVPLVQGTDYTIGAYDPADHSILVIFSREVTDRNLIPQGGNPGPGGSTPGTQDPSLPGPGVFRFDLSSAILRARVVDARLDGDSDGFAASNENYSQDEVVGDAGDKFTAEVDNIGTAQDPQIVDMYGPADLDLVMDNNLTPDGLPDPNRDLTIRGAIGDHPDNDVNNFRLGGDTDIYKITLQAGQILRMGKMSGSALLAGRFLFDANQQQVFGNSDEALELPVAPLDFVAGDVNTSDDFLIKTTGTYYIVITNSGNFGVPGVVPNIAPGAGNTGDYQFTMQVFDDGDSGFAASNNSGNGTPVVNAPAAIVFAGPNGVFQNPSDPTYDDLSVVTVGDYRFTLDAGPDGVRGTADDIVTGGNGGGITSTQSGGLLTSTIYSAIGPTGHVGIPGAVTSDVDIYNLNNGQTITPGTLITVTIKLADLGSDLGSFDQTTLTDFRGNVQFGVFDTTDATNVTDAKLVFSPTDFHSRAGTPNQVLATSGDMSYGYDSNGDFYITFVAPDHLGGAPGQAAKFALYLQGSYNTDYSIQVQQAADPTLVSIPKAKQNIFLETAGGEVNWLEAGGLTTQLLPFASSVLGFTGQVAGVPVDQYIISHVLSTLQSVFNATGYNIVISTDPSAFEFQDFSTIILSSSNDPTTIFNRSTYGYSQHSDPLNMDRNDEGLIFLPSFAPLGYTPSQADVDAFVLSLSGAVGRRIGELMGLRITTNSSLFDNPIDIMSANSVSNIPFSPAVYGVIDDNRDLSDPNDSVPNTNFFLGQQSAFSLLDKFLTT